MTPPNPTPPAIGIPRRVDDLLVTLTAIPDATRTLPRGIRRRAVARIVPWLQANGASSEAARPTRLEIPALTAVGTIRATVSLETGPAGIGDDGTCHWHLAMSIASGGTRRPAPDSEIAAWIALGWPKLVGAAVDTYVMGAVIGALQSARHAHLPAHVARRLAG